ncbi:MAG: M15 family metallopeptidase [Ruminococcus sp.]
MQDKSKAKHRYHKSKPAGLYTSSDRQYVYGDNTPRSKGRVTKVLFVVLPIVMVVVLVGGFLLGYVMYRNQNNQQDNQVTANEGYISPEQKKTLYRIVSVADPLDRTFVPDTVDYKGVPVSEMAIEQLENLVNAAAKEGISLTVKRGYVSYDEQHTLYTDYVNDLLSTGKYTQVKAESIANRKICDSGNSERQLGLLIEFDCESKDKFDETEEFRWLDKLGAEYGFVQRYTKANEQRTAMDNDFTLWRYVGSDNALLARKLGLSFDELIDYLES